MSDHTYASAIVGAQKLHKRKPADFYPTPPDVTIALMDFLNINERIVWEPACGDGAMAEVLRSYGHDVIATDLRDDSGYGKGGVNFLDTTPDEHWHIADWIITNPPFNVAAKFIEHALSITPNVAMLLKSQYWHASSREKLFEEHPPTWVLPLTWRPSFLEAERGNSPLMDVVWCIWTDVPPTEHQMKLVFPNGKSVHYAPLPRPAAYRRNGRRKAVAQSESRFAIGKSQDSESSDLYSRILGL